MPSFSTRRVVTGQDEDGAAIVVSESSLPSVRLDDAADLRLLWSTDTFPSDNADKLDGAEREVGLVSPGGSALMITSLAPGAASPHHRTLSLDYGIVLTGEVELTLDGGETVHLTAGDVVVQRGTIHTWRNVGDEPSRMAFVLLDAQPVRIGERLLEPEVHPPAG